MSVSINGTNGLTFSDASTQNTSAFTGGLGFRNRIINGAMMIDQRNAGASVSISSYGYGVDRFGYQCSGGGVFSSQQSTTVVPANFSNSLALTVTTADASIGSTDVYQLFQKIEGFNVADLGFGTANAQTITISFWVRSSITGTYSASIQNASFNRGYVSTFTINAANTWEQKTLTIAGDTTGTWTTTNGIGLQLAIDLGSGTASNITSGSWQATTTSTLRTSGSVNFIATSGATFYITGVQLEKGSTATSFDYRPYGTELALCQRYFYAAVNVPVFGTGGSGYSPMLATPYGTTSTTTVGVQLVTTVSLRTVPTLTVADPNAQFGLNWQGPGGWSGASSWTLYCYNMNYNLFRVTFVGNNSTSTIPTGAMSNLQIGTNCQLFLSAEL